MKSTLLLTALVALSSTAFARDYVGLGIETGAANYSGYEFVNPRITGMVQDNNSPNTTAINLVVGRTYSEFRGEIELSLGNNATFTSYHSPFNTFAQVKEVSSNRAMVNLIKDIDLGYRLKPYVAAGLGVAMNTAEGFQGPFRNSFEKRTTYALAYSLGVGAQVKVGPRSQFDISYRYVNAGDASTGASQFIPYDEQYKGKFVTNSLRAAITYDFR